MRERTFVIVGGVSAEAVPAARLPEDRPFRVVLIEVGGPPAALMPAAC